MAIIRHAFSYEALSAEELAKWRDVPPAVAGDIMNREWCTSSRISPLAQGSTLVGHARTVSVMSGDNGAIHIMNSLVQPGEIIVIAGRGAQDVALIGEIIVHCAKSRGVAGFVVDGSVRDVSALRDCGIPIYAAGATPRGPHKGFGGELDCTISCGDVPVNPGDLILGDDDGITVVPRDRCASVLKAGLEKVAQEADILAQIDKGATTAEIQGLEIPDPI